MTTLFALLSSGALTVARSDATRKASGWFSGLVTLVKLFQRGVIRLSLEDVVSGEAVLQYTERCVCNILSSPFISLRLY